MLLLSSIVSFWQIRAARNTPVQACFFSGKQEVLSGAARPGVNCRPLLQRLAALFHDVHAALDAFGFLRVASLFGAQALHAQPRQ